MEFYEYLARWGLPREGGWVGTTAAVGLLVVLLMSFLVLYWPGRLPGTLPGSEQAAVRRPLVRWLNAWMPLAAASLMLGLATTIAEPRTPRIPVLSRPGTSVPEPAAKRAAEAWPGWPQVDVRPMVSATLERLHSVGGAAWSSALPASVDKVRLACRDEIDAYLNSGRMPTPRGAIEPELPAWIVESVEITILTEIARHERAPAAFVDVITAPADAGWGVVRDISQSSECLIDVAAETDVRKPVIRLLYSAAVERNGGQIQGGALVDSASDGTVTVHVQNADREVIHSLTHTVTPGFQLVSIDEAVPAEVAAEATWLVAAGSGVSTPLIALGTSGTPSLRLAMPISEGDNITAAPFLEYAWSRQLDGAKSQLKDNLLRLGAAIPPLANNSAAPGEPTLVTLPNDRGVLILAPGLQLSDVPTDWYDQDHSVSHPGVAVTSSPVPSFGFHPILLEGRADVDSLMAIGVELNASGSPTVPLPKSSDRTRIVARGVRPNTTLESGVRGFQEHSNPGGELAVYPLLETGAIDGKPVVLIRLSPQRILADIEPAKGNCAEQSRARAFVSAVVRAANLVAHGTGSALTPRPSDAARSVYGFPLLTSNDRQHLETTANRAVDSVGLLLVSAGLGVFTLQGWMWRR